jgi:cyanophycinase
MIAKQPKGTLIVIGGAEERGKEGEREVLAEVARRARRRKGPLVVFTVATRSPDEVFDMYRATFRSLGVDSIAHVDIRSRDDAKDPSCVRRVEEAGVVFFSGGDQLRITSQLGDSPTYQALQDRYYSGLLVAGTSAGAAAMPETMIVSGPGDESTEISAIGMAPGLALLPNVVVDSHFAQRGRIGRLIGAVAQNPKNLGFGIDEDTAMVVEQGETFEVIGSGAVYVVDGRGISFSGLSDGRPEGVLSVFGIRLNVMAGGDRFDLVNARPILSAQGEQDAAG